MKAMNSPRDFSKEGPFPKKKLSDAQVRGLSKQKQTKNKQTKRSEKTKKK